MPAPTMLKNSSRLLIACAGILIAGCQDTQKHPAGLEDSWDSLKTSLQAPSGALNARMSIRCVVLEGKPSGLKEGLNDWDEVEKLRDSMGDKVRVRNACTLVGLKEGAVEAGYYLTPVNPEAGPKALHGLRFQIREVRLSGQELSCQATISFGRHQTDLTWPDGRSGLAVKPFTQSVEKNVQLRMRSNQVQVLDLSYDHSHIALIEIIPTPTPATETKPSK